MTTPTDKDLRALAEAATPYEGYTVDRDGNVWSYHPWRGQTRRKLTPHPNSKGYLAVKVKHEGRMKKALIHKMVCEAFHGAKPSPSHQVRHLNGVRSDNRDVNLRWGTPSENAQDRKRHGTERAVENARAGAGKLRGSKNVSAKVTEAQVVQIRMRYAAGEGPRSIAKAFGVHRDTVRLIVRRETWTHI